MIIDEDEVQKLWCTLLGFVNCAQLQERKAKGRANGIPKLVFPAANLDTGQVFMRPAIIFPS
jgi:hypothetical protein